jgi:hypothetical protein
MTNETPSDPVAESPFEIDEEAHTVATIVGSLGEVDTSDTGTDPEGTYVATEVGTLGWPEGAENEEGTGPS